MSDPEQRDATERLLDALDVAFDQARQGRRPTREQLAVRVRALVAAAAAAAPTVAPRRPARGGRAVANDVEGGAPPREP